MYYVDPIIKNFFRTNQPQGRGTYVRLDQNENPDGLPKWLFDGAIKKITPEFLSLYPEDIILTEKCAKLYGLEKENVSLTDGSVVAMGYVIKVFGRPGKKMVCATPTFGMYKVYADMQNIETVFVHYESDFTFDSTKLLAAIDRETTIVSIVNPNMPVGNVYSEEEIVAIVEKAKKFNAIVIIDEAYYYFYDKNYIELINKYDNVIILRTFSKMLSIPALRIGLIISNKSIIQCINNYKPHYTVNGVALLFGEAIVDNHERLILELNEKFTKGKNFLTNALRDNDYKYIPTEGCFICIYPKYKTAEFITDELKKRGILIFCGKGDSAGLLRVTIWGKKYMESFVNALLEIDKEG